MSYSYISKYSDRKIMPWYFQSMEKMNSYITGKVWENTSVPNLYISYGRDGNLSKPYDIVSVNS